MVKKAVALISGGLDSTLAARLMLEQGVELVGLYLSAPWGCCDKTKAMKVAGQLKIPFMVIKMNEEYLTVIRKPKYGYGSSMNPCIYCRIYMFHKAKELMYQVGASFLVTGEVLGQRPMSQMPRSLQLIEEDSRLARLIVRPLSAKVLPATLPEEQGIVDRQRLCGITGRSRKPQMALAQKLGILDYPNPAGGCMLTDKQFGDRVRDLFEHQEEIDLEDMELLRLGRHFRFDRYTKLIVGRDEEENRTLEEYLAPGRIFITPDDFAGPSVLLVGPPNDQAKELGVRAIARYTKTEKRPLSPQVICKVGVPRGEGNGQPPTETLPLGEAIDADALERMRI
jgi:tRNA U34 2-thiouridine synthase MnmA/TrmU